MDWDAWLLKPGMPPVTNTFSNELGAACAALGDRWLAGPAAGGAAPAAADVAAWSSAELIAFLDYLLDKVEPGKGLSLEGLQQMDSLYQLSASRNSEIRFRWQRLCIKLRAGFIVPQVVDFLKSQGRMKFTRPLYRDLFAWPEHKSVAVDTFSGWAENYHPICRQMVSKDLGLVK